MSRTRTVTGRQALTIAVGAFGLVFAVNGLMAWHAVRTFPGVEVDNSYIASQGFNARLANQQALGWQALVRVEGGVLHLTLRGPDGAPVAPRDLTGVVGRATHDDDDMTLALAPTAGGFAAPVTLAPGYWNLRLVAHAEDGTLFQQRIGFFHREGAP